MGLETTPEPLRSSFDDRATYTTDAKAWSSINSWLVEASRSARWMDLLGDYAGAEHFVIDGEALFQIVLDDPLLSIGRDGCSFQITHAYHSLERILEEYQRRRANFEIVFWDDTKHISIQTEGKDFTVASRALARSMLFSHLLKLPFGVHVFQSLDDPLWIQYAIEKKPMFVMSNDGNFEGAVTRSPITFLQRAFLLNILSRGISVTLLNGAEYRDSKILSFVHEPLIGGEDVLSTLQPAIDSIKDSLQETLASKLDGDDCLLRLERPLIPATEEGLTTVLEELHILRPIRQQVPPEIIYLFVVHILLVPSLTLHQRAQARRNLPSNLEVILRRDFLTPVFFRMAKLLSSQDIITELDGTIYTTLISLALTHSEDIGTIIGDIMQQKAHRIWGNLGGPALDFNVFRSRYSLPENLIPSPSPQLKEARPLLPFFNPIFNDKFSMFDLSSDADIEADSLNQNRVQWSDDKHWHNQKPILPRHLGRLHSEPINPKELRQRLRATQVFMDHLQDQAATLTGAAGVSLRQMVIVPITTSKSKFSNAERKRINGYPVRPAFKTKKTLALKSSEKLKHKIEEERIAASKTSSEHKWAEHLSTMSKQPLSTKLALITTLFRNTKLVNERHILVEMQLYRIQLELETWIADDSRALPARRDEYTVSLMKMIQEICRRKVITPFAKNALTTVLIALGFGDFIESVFSKLEIIEDAPGFRFTKLVRSRTKTALSDYDFMRITEHPVIWQLRLFGDYMNRSMDSFPDERVGFEPDAWQRRVLDGIDQNKSLLVVAPTSAGKTFISFYAMEKVLKGSNDGIIVYVAPTKALVTQIAAEIYARFKKDLNGKSCWAVHTRDYRIHDPQDCQILITVPEMLAILLLSPPMAKTWTPRIKRIVLDEIHSIGEVDVGPAWEQILLFAPCPIIGLSATIGSPKMFSDWLASIQKAHGFDYDFIEHHHRYSHLRKFFYLTDGKGSFNNLNDHQITGRMKFMHPITMLLFGAKGIPTDLSLEAKDTLSLYYALSSVERDIPSDIRALDPKVFFHGSTDLLHQKDVLDYEAKLKAVVAGLLPSFNPRDLGSPLGRIIHSLQDQNPSLGEEESMKNNDVSSSAIQHDLVVLLADLHVKGDLPALLFSFDRSHCEVLVQRISSELETAEKRWRAQSSEWSHKISEWEAWKERERAFMKARKQKKDDNIRDSAEPSWHCSFDPTEPSPQFTFAGRNTAYSMSQIKDKIKELRWSAGIPSWVFDALKRGIAVHHAGMHRHYRGLVENLFRKGFVRVMVATGTLALGINAPAKTSIFVGDTPFLTALMYRQCAGRAGRRGFDLRGNVIFYGLPLDRVRRLVLSKLPMLRGSFPLTLTTTLRLFNLLNGSDNADVAVRAVKNMLSLPQITMNSNFGQDQLLHHLRFNIEYLRRSSLLDHMGRPIDLAAVAAHLFYTEPSNLALVALLRSGVLHEICNQNDRRSAKRIFMLVMCNLFGRKYLSKGFTEENNIKALVKKYPSIIVLPPLPAAVQKVLIDHDEDILQTFQGYALTFAKRLESVDDTLPLSGLRIRGINNCAEIAPIHHYLQETAIPIAVRSLFVANSGHGDSFKNVLELTRTSREGLNLNHHAIPAMSDFIRNPEVFEHRLNAYILDFYTHGQCSTLEEANCIRRGDVWHLLHDFALTLMSVRSALLQLLSKTPQGDEASIMADDTSSEGLSNVAEGKENEIDSTFKRPPGTSTEDWKLLMTVHEVCEEFTVKFRAMWAQSSEQLSIDKEQVLGPNWAGWVAWNRIT